MLNVEEHLNRCSDFMKVSINGQCERWFYKHHIIIKIN